MTIKIETSSAWDIYSEFYPRTCKSREERILFVRGWKMMTKEALFSECSAALQFPPRRSENWAAFDEDLTSLEWIGVRLKVVVVLEAETVLQDESDHDRLVFFSILQDAPAAHAVEWLSRGNLEGELQIILQCAPQNVERLEQLLARAGTTRG